MATDPVPSRTTRAAQVAAVLASLEVQALPIIDPDAPPDPDPFDPADDTPWVPFQRFLAYHPVIKTDAKGRMQLTLTIDRKTDLNAFAVTRHQLSSLRVLVERPMVGAEREDYEDQLCELEEARLLAQEAGA